MSKQDYIEIECKKIEHLLKEDLILLVTATDLETEFTHNNLKPIDGYTEIIKVFEGNQTYYFGMFGLYKVAHVQCAMGSISRASSIMTVSTALGKLKSKIVIMVGIAFGVDEKNQKIGDVFVAESVIPYNIKRVGKDKDISRGIETQSSQILLNRFKNIKNWEHTTIQNNKSEVIFTRLLSGEELVDNLEHRNSLVAQYPDSKGGEMEGAGVYSACGSKIDCILVKGICDFADGEKGKNKRQNQEIAITAALNLCSILFSSKTVFKELNVLPFENKSAESFSENRNINEVLFDFYDVTKEPYYIERESDAKFNQVLNQYGIWVFGPSGCGKSNLIIRNILKTKKEFIQINLAPCIGQDVESFFKEILYEISSKVGGVQTQFQPSNFSECSRELISFLNKYYENKELIIFIEEIPINSEKDQKEFAEKIFSIIISKNFINGLSKIKFVLSSIQNPAVNIPLVQHKIHQQISFIPLEYWLEEDIVDLIELILNEFKFILKSEFKKELIASAKGSPRFIKKFFRSIYTLNKVDDKTLRVILKETERELG
jgi:nucleoside phosphorylase